MDEKNHMSVSGRELEEEITAFLNGMANQPGGKRTKPGCNVIHGKG